MLREFRNHLSDLNAAANDLHGALPPALALRLGDAIGETERSVEGLTALVSLVEASLLATDAGAVVCDLGAAMERAVLLAAPALGQRAKVIVERSERAGIRNRGSMLECMLAMLVVDLAQARGADPGKSPCVVLRAEAVRGSLSIDIESDGVPPAEASWRLALAHQLAAKLGARVLPQTEAAYVVQFR